MGITTTGLTYKTPVPPISGIIPYPPELAEYIAEGFMIEYVMSREHLGLPNEGFDELKPPPPTSGEIRGELLRHVNAPGLLVHFASVGVKWPESHTLWASPKRKSRQAASEKRTKWLAKKF